MHKFVAAALGAGAAVAALAAVPASARDGCGRNFHRYHGRCVPNRAIVRPQPRVRLVIGNYYPGRGYWDGRRYWQHRYRHQNRWRYQ